MTLREFISTLTSIVFAIGFWFGYMALIEWAAARGGIF